METMEERYNSAGLQYNVTVEDLQEIIVEEKRYRYVTTLLHRQLGSNWVPDVYHNLEEIRERIDFLVATHSDYSKLKKTYDHMLGVPKKGLMQILPMRCVYLDILFKKMVIHVNYYDGH